MEENNIEIKETNKKGLKKTLIIVGGAIAGLLIAGLLTKTKDEELVETEESEFQEAEIIEQQENIE